MNRIILFAAMAIVMSMASAALALDNAALVGTWQLVENAKDKDGKPCPFVGQQILVYRRRRNDIRQYADALSTTKSIRIKRKLEAAISRILS